MEQGRSEESLKQLQDQLHPAQQRRLKLQTDCQMVAAQNHNQPPPSQKCPRCDSSNTKFCYYNNYSLSQPRYFCKACRRYWTQGGTLRNVPVGGGCRKSKRSKPSSESSTSNSADVARIQSLSSPALSSQNFTGMINSGQSSRTLPPVNVPTVGNNPFYTGGAFLSSLAAMQSLPTGVNQMTGVNFGGGSHFGANMALLRGINIPPLKPQPPQQFQVQNEFYPSQQSLIPQRPLNSWTQSFINRGAANSTAGSSSYWGGANVGNTPDGGDQAAAGSSFNPNQWSDNLPGFDPSL